MNKHVFLRNVCSLAATPLLGQRLFAGAAPAVRGRRPNGILIMTDPQFGDAMSCRMGRQYLNTPTMDGLAASGVVFTRAYSANPLCMPFRNALFTGRYPHKTRVTMNARPKGGLDPKEFVCMGNYFQNAGYETAGADVPLFQCLRPTTR